MLEGMIYHRENNTLIILDQLKVPNEVSYISIITIDHAFKAIKSMQTRGAPAIALVGMLALTIELRNRIDSFVDEASLMFFLNESLTTLYASRPTAVNLKNEGEKVRMLASSMAGSPTKNIISAIVDHVHKVFLEEKEINKSIGAKGRDFLLNLLDKKESINVLTHCNTGSLATTGYGTALGVIRALNESKLLGTAYCTETRPYNQGSRLTAFELVQEGMDGCLICDDMVGALMQQGKVDAVFVGADRVVKNGDTANKIGTYQIAVLAKHHKIPFFVACPLSTIDARMESGAEIKIEERPAAEMTTFAGVKTAPDGIRCWNPSFDVTPHELITGIITEKAVVPPGDLMKHYDQFKQ